MNLAEMKRQQQRHRGVNNGTVRKGNQPLFDPKAPAPEMRAGDCAGGCDCNACPTNGQNVTVMDIANLLGRRVAGLSGRCKYNVLHLTNANRAAGIAAAATETLTIPNAQIGMCVQQIVAVTRDVAVPDTERSFNLSNFNLANEPQWLQNRLYHSALFHFDAECSCCLPGDCTTIGTLVSMVATNTSASAANIDVYLIGPSAGR